MGKRGGGNSPGGKGKTQSKTAFIYPPGKRPAVKTAPAAPVETASTKREPSVKPPAPVAETPVLREPASVSIPSAPVVDEPLKVDASMPPAPPMLFEIAWEV